MDKAREELVVEAAQQAMSNNARDTLWSTVERVYRPKHGDDWLKAYLEGRSDG
jgi:hypothetical protein